ncbi:MAG TPA: phosphoribosyltransferase domain-containing protein [Rubrobacteraceae bacterium]|nr:phosphoribosyltransferase domain-containing protein [Rubrobacteraceae bacterium]
MDPLRKPGSALPASVLGDLPVTLLLRVERDGNPLRRFGHVSPHIGKISPLDATALRGIAGLATSLLPPYPGPTLVVGMTESALLLSWFIAERLAAQPGVEVDLRFTTREHRRASPSEAGNGACRTFLEPHSHGPVHSLALPAGHAYPRAVIVEDELTTGATLRNLLLAIHNTAPRHHVVTLCDGRPPESRERLHEEMRALGVELSVVDLSRTGDTPPPSPTNGHPNGHTPPIRNPFGRPAAMMDGAVEELRRRWLSSRPGRLYAIGECVDVAVAFWESLPTEERPAFRHVTRSPWLVDGEAITSRLDLHAPPIPSYFLYNFADESPPRRALLVGERSTAPVAARLRRFLRARGVEAEAVEVPTA